MKSVAIIGAGLMGRRRAMAATGSGDRVVAIVDTDPARATRLAEEVHAAVVTSWEDAIRMSDVDAVVITTPPVLHATMAIAALEAGKHVLCEKPLAMTVREAEQMVEAAVTYRRVLKCGFNLRVHPAVHQAHAWMEEGRVGEPLFLRARLGTGSRPGFEKEWRADPARAGGGELMDQGVHLIDLSRWFLGEIVDARGMLGRKYWQIPAEENAFLLLEAANGAMASLHASWTQWTPLFSLEMYGSRGSVTAEGLGGAYGTERVTFRPLEHLKPFREETIEYRGEDRSWGLEWQEFSDAVTQDREPNGSGRDGLEALRVVERVTDDIRAHVRRSDHVAR